MKRTQLLTLLLSIFFATTAFTQPYKLSGKIVNAANSQPIEFANITLLKSDSTYVAGNNSDINGHFEFSTPEGNYIISTSCMGYEQTYTNINHTAGNGNEISISLQPSAIQLEDVTVTAQSVINKSDRKLITPSSGQVKASTNGFDLLKKLQLARINIDPINNTVSTVGKGEVQLRINGVLVTNAEIQALSPEDIVRIEYHDDPGIRYGNAAAVLDYITKRKTSGGNINANLGNSISKNFGYAEDHFSTKYNNKNSEFSANAYYNYRRIDWTRENNETFHFPTKTIQRDEIGEPTEFKTRALYSTLNYSLMNKDNYYFNAALRYNYEDTPNAYTDRKSKLFVSGSKDPMSIIDHSTSNSKSPVLDLYFQRNLKNDQLLIFNAVSTYINSSNTRLYQESRKDIISTDILSDISGDKYSLIAEGIYEKKLKSGKLTGGIKHAQSYTENGYKGTTVANIAMKQADTYIYGEYQIKVGKFNYMVNLKGSRFYYSQAENNNKQYSIQPSARVTYNPNDNLYFRYRFNVWNNTPSLSYLNNVQQDIDSLQIRRGNPNLKSFTSYMQTFEAGFNKEIFSVDFYLQYLYQSKPIMESILFEDGSFIRTYNNQKSYKRIFSELNMKFKPLKDNLSIGFTPGVNYYVSTGNDYKHTFTNPYMRIEVNGMYKNVNGSFSIYTPWNYMYGEEIQGGERLHILSFGYKRPKWSISVMSFNPFTSSYKQNSENKSALNPVRSKIYTNNLAQSLMMTVSFNIDYGRKFSGGEKRINNSDTDSGIMSGSR